MANEKRLIDANALKTKVFNLTLYVQGLRFGKTVINNILESYRRGVFEEIDNAPTVDAVELVHGRWEQKEFWTDGGTWRCSECGRQIMFMKGTPITEHMYYCPSCGAKMDGGNEE
jgi:DNA-directed RNA polymerase subunit RPC12/RpoP